MAYTVAEKPKNDAFANRVSLGGSCFDSKFKKIVSVRKSPKPISCAHQGNLISKNSPVTILEQHSLRELQLLAIPKALEQLPKLCERKGRFDVKLDCN
jgi:hypothetical protein